MNSNCFKCNQELFTKYGEETHEHVFLCYNKNYIYVCKECFLVDAAKEYLDQLDIQEDNNEKVPIV